MKCFNMCPYHLESVLDIADDYHEIPDLLMRYATLEATNNDLRDNDRNYLEMIEKSRAELQSYTKAGLDTDFALGFRVWTLPLAP